MNSEQANAAQPQPNDGRDARGRFAPGNPGGPGNPFGRKVAAFRQLLIECVTEDDFRRVMAALVAKAAEGNVQAMKLFFSYVVGKPDQSADPDRMDIDEWNVYRDAVPMKPESAALIQAGDPEFHLKCVRVTRPIMTEVMQQQVDQMFNETPEQREAREAAQDAEDERYINQPVKIPEGWNADGTPIPKDETGKRPSPNRRKRPAPPPPPYGNNGPSPSPYGDCGVSPPSPYGDYGPPPSPNGEKRTVPPGDGRFPPSPSGGLPPDRP